MRCLAFTAFAGFEYVIVILNVLFHYSAVYEFGGLRVFGTTASGLTAAARLHNKCQ